MITGIPNSGLPLAASCPCATALNILPLWICFFISYPNFKHMHWHMDKSTIGVAFRDKIRNEALQSRTGAVYGIEHTRKIKFNWTKHLPQYETPKCNTGWELTNIAEKATVECALNTWHGISTVWLQTTQWNLMGNLYPAVDAKF